MQKGKTIQDLDLEKGQTYMCTYSDSSLFRVGTLYLATAKGLPYEDDGQICTNSLSRFALIEEDIQQPLTPHPHRKSIIAWAHGRRIQVRKCKTKDWKRVETPSWTIGWEYREEITVESEVAGIQEQIKELECKLEQLSSPLKEK